MSLVDVARKVIFNPQIRDLLLQAFQNASIDKMGAKLPNTPFTKLVQFQIAKCKGADELHKRGFQVGEPFTGDIEKAKVLFVSSNPAYNHNEDSPYYDADNDCIKMPNYDFATGKRTSGETVTYENNEADTQKMLDKFFKIRMDHMRIPLINSSDTDSVGYWTNARNFAYMLKPNVPFALTEVVQYRSSHEYGMTEALPVCWPYAEKVISCSPAKVIVINKASVLEKFRDSDSPLLGQSYQQENSQPYGKDGKSTIINLWQETIGGKKRLIINTRFGQTMPYKAYFCTNSQILKKIRDVL